MRNVMCPEEGCGMQLNILDPEILIGGLPQIGQVIQEPKNYKPPKLPWYVTMKGLLNVNSK